MEADVLITKSTSCHTHQHRYTTVKSQSCTVITELLTFMLLVGRIVDPHGDEDEEDKEWPDDLNQQLDLKEKRSEVMRRRRSSNPTTT